MGAVELREFIASNRGKGQKYVDLMSGDTDKSTRIISSNLRRAISTTVIGLWDRFTENQQKVYTLTTMQELTRNVDGYCITPAGKTPLPSAIEQEWATKMQMDVASFYSKSI